MKKLLLFISLFLLAVTQADAQRWVDRLGKTVENAAKRTVERKAEQKTEQAVGKAVDKATDNETNKGSENDKNTDMVEWPETETEPSETGKSVDSKKNIPQQLEAYSKYDFVPGDQILFYEDFSQDAIGDFPALWTTNASGEIKTINIAPGKWLQSTTEGGMFTYLKNLDLPPNFILEFDYIPYLSDERRQTNPNERNYLSGAVKLYTHLPGKEKEFDSALYPGDMGLRIHFNYYSWYADAYNEKGKAEIEGKSDKNCVLSEQVNHIIVWVQGRRVRMYHGGAKIIDVPTLLPPDVKMTRLRLDNDYEYNRPFFSNIKITTAAPDTRSKLITEGKLITYGITFDVNKDIVKSESYGTLKSIADVLTENPDVKVKITGHTDSDGADEANLDLSRRRAQSVKNELSKSFGIDASRMETEGAGESQPLASNDTSENKAKNRRVEFVKQ